MFALALALGSSLCWGVSDFLGGLQSRRQPLLAVMLTSQGVALVVLVAVVAIAGVAPPAAVKLLPALGAGAAGVLALSAFYRALSIGTMSIVAPIAATGVAVPVVVGIAGGERPAALQLGGIATAVIGVVLASREEDAALPDPMPSPARRDRIRAAASGDRRRPPARRDRSRPAASRDRTRSPASISVLLALIAAIGFGTFFVALRSTARVNLAWALLAARASGAAVLVAAAAVERTAPVRDRPALAALVVIGLLDLAANGFYALATRHGLLSVVSVGASLYPLATVLLARVVLRERVRRVQEVGIVAALAGVVLIAAG